MFSELQQRNSQTWVDLEDRLGYRFANRDLLQQALTHRSHSLGHNERLEFLGDSVLGCVMSSLLHARFPQSPEGALTRWRSALVCRASLTRLARTLHLGETLRMGGGESKSGGHQRASLLANGMEAVLGAVFMDGGYVAAESVIRQIFREALQALDTEKPAKDPKTRLQEHLQSLHQPLPKYALLNVHGAPHAQEFHVQCFAETLNLKGEGRGKTRRMAEQMAADDLWNKLGLPTSLSE